MRLASFGSGVLLASIVLTSAGAARAQSNLPPPPPPPPGEGPPATATQPPAAAPAQPAPAQQTQPAAQPGPRPAPAEVPPPDERSGPLPAPMIAGSSAGAEVYWFSAKDIGSGLPIIPFLKLQLNDELVLDFHLPIGVGVGVSVFRDDSKTVMSLGNPTVGLTYFKTDDRLTWHIGGRVSAPLAGASDDTDWQIANFISLYSTLLWDAHYWASKYLPIGARAGFEYFTNPKGTVALRGALEPTFYIPVGEKSSFALNERKALFFYQMRFEGEYLGSSGWGGGAGLQIVHAVSEGDALSRGDNAQGGIEPFAGYNSPGMFARIGYLIGLDSPLGFGLDSRKVASLRLNIGTKF